MTPNDYLPGMDPIRDHKVTIHAQLAGEQPRDDAGKYLVLFIQAAEANGFTFSRQVIEDSAPLWENANVFVDHSFWGRSVRDLGGVLSKVHFDDLENGLTAELTPCGPSAEIVHEAARIMLGTPPLPDLGFSADLIFSADTENNVGKILQPLSVDLVVDPAFATKFIRQLNQKGVHPMADPKTPVPSADDTADLRSLIQAQQIEAGRQLLELKLSNAGLPEPAEKEIRTRFDGHPFKPAELDTAVQAWKDSLAAATAPDEIKGPARFHSMFDSKDQIQAAIDDLVGAPREPGAENLKVAKFQGIKEAYLHLTGDRDFVGGYFPDRVQFQHTTATFPNLVANALNKSLAREWAQLGRAGYDWWQKIATIEHFQSLQDIQWTLFGTIASLSTIEEGAEYPELHIGDAKETSEFLKYGGYIGLTLEALDKDDTRKLKAIPRELANAGLRNISSLVAAIFTTGSAAGPTLNDTGTLFNDTALTTRGGHKNLKTTALGTDFTAWDAAAQVMYEQPMLVADEAGYYGTGKACAIEPKYCLVPRELKAAAEALFIPRWAVVGIEQASTKGGVTYAGYVEPITVPEWTDDTDWCAVADPAIMPGIMIGERFGLLPQIFVAGSEIDPAMFANDESRIKVRHFLAVGVCDFRPFVKSNV